VLVRPYLRKLKFFALILTALRSCLLVLRSGQFRIHFLKNRVLKGQSSLVLLIIKISALLERKPKVTSLKIIDPLQIQSAAAFKYSVS
jgi:hypothetical protein